MKILAIDASTKSSGIAIFEDTTLLGFGTIKASSVDLIKRIHKMVDTIDTLVTECNIQHVVMEEVIPDHTKNNNTFKALSWLQAAIMIMMHDKHPTVTVELVYPSSWRSACGIKNGRGVRREQEKLEDIKFANKTYNLNLTSDDEADAICIGHAHIYPKANNDELNWG